MSVSGKVKEYKEYSKSVGLFEAKVVAVNPTKSELEKLLKLGKELERDPEYVGVDDESGRAKVTLSVWLEEAKKGQLFNVRFFLKDEDRENRTKDKLQYINTVGFTAWADQPDNLPSWFLDIGKEYRVAKVGEDELYSFGRSWLNKLDTRESDGVLDFEWKKLMKGNVKEMTDHLKAPYADTVLALATIKVSENKQGEVVDYQQVYNKAFLPGYMMKFFTVGGKKVPKSVTKFTEGIEDPEYGCKEFYGNRLGMLREYNPAENLAAQDGAISEGGSDY